MPKNIDELQIEINAKAQSANDAIDRLVGKLDRLSASLGRLNTSNLNTLAMGVNRLGTAMQTMNGVKTADFTRLAKNLERLNLIDVSNLSSISASVNHMATAFNQLGNVSENALSIGEMAKNIAKLGNKSVQTAITNIPQLAVAMRDLLTTLSTAPNVSRNIIDMTNALANLANQGSRVGSASRSIVRGMNNTTSSMNRARKSTTSLAAAFGKFYATWFLVIRGAKQFMNAIESTADYIEAYNYYNVALGKIASDWGQDWEKYGYANAEAYADSFTDRLNKSLSKLSGLQIDESQQLLTDTGLKNLGLNIQEITQYASQLASVTNSVGQTGEVSLAAASAFTKLAGDISSLFNIDFSSAAQNIQSGLIGQSRALYKYGIDITNATLQTYAYNLGLEKAVSEMTQAEKMQLRMIAILDQSKVSWGDLSRTLNSPSNLMRQFTNNVKEAGMVLGQLFIPVLQKILPVVNGVVIAIKRLLVSIAQLLGVKLDLDSFGQGYADLTDGFDDMADSLGGVASAAKKAKAGLRAFDELKVINMSETSGGAGGVGGGAIDLTDEILKATEEYERVWQEAYDRMANKAQEIADKISKMLEPIRKIFEDFAIGDFFQAGEDVSHLVASIFNFFADAIDKVDWYGIGQKIGDFFAGIDWIAVLSSIGNLIWQALKASVETWKGMFDAAPIETAIITAIGALKFSGLGTELINTLNTKMSATLAGKHIGLVPTVVISAITWIVAFDVGKSLGEFLFPEDAKYYQNFTWFGEGGFFDTISKDWGTTLDGFVKMLTDFENNPVIAILANTLSGPFISGVAQIKNGIDKIYPYIKEFVENVISKFEKIKSKAEDIVEKIKTIFKIENIIKIFSGFKEGIKNVFKTAANIGIGLLNKMIGGIETFINNALEAVRKLAEIANYIPGVNIDVESIKVDLPRIQEIPAYSIGGFPEDGLFMANHTELVGRFANGRTAVANNDMITAGIEEAAYRGFMRAMSETGGMSANVTFQVEGDPNGMFRVWKQEWNRETRGTRKNPVIIYDA